MLAIVAGVAVVLTILTPFLGVPLDVIVAFIAHRRGQRTIRNVLVVIAALMLAWIVFVAAA